MNLAEAMKHVLKHPGQNLFTHFWQDDLKVILVELKNDVQKFINSSPSKFKALKENGFKNTVEDMVESAVDTITIFKEMPGRISDAFHFFREDFLDAMDDLEDPKQKAVFSLKVIGALSSFAVGTFYGFKKTQRDVSIKGFTKKGALTQYIVMEVVFRLSQLFILRFISEVEKNLTEEEDLGKPGFFKSMLSDSSKLPENEGDETPEVDKAFQIVEALKNYIITGDR